MPVILISAASAEKLSYSISPNAAPSNVYAKSAARSLGSGSVTPRPISSSGVKAIRIGPCEISGWANKWRAAVIMMEIPALSSAPSKVVPEAVTMSWPIFSPR